MVEPNITITQELKKLARGYMAALAAVSMIHPIVTGYQKAILKEIDARNIETGEPLTNPEYLHLIGDDKFEIYRKRCDEEAAKKGMEHEPDCCPLLEAELLERANNAAFCKYILPFVGGFEGISYNDLSEHALDENGEIIIDELGRRMFDRDIFGKEMLSFILTIIDIKLIDKI